ncbi:MAG: tyrosine phenol-lyase [Bacteroidetes bacterium HGW-Bacteroidetes-21]|nr:MAG: tyrosine phenol-lyase [Bacteroidetes bacterium HGW-Bacteroidetes-21]
MELPYSEPFKIKMVETIKKSTREQRLQWVKEANYNLFKLSSDKVYIDLLTDSGTGAMSDKQWGAIMTGDESYAGASSYFTLKNTIKELLGFEYMLPTHQGRAAENVLFSVLVKEGHIVPGNSHFDTTKGHIEFRKAHAVDCTISEAFDTTFIHPFKGNVDLEKLEKVMIESGSKVPFIIMTITNNTAGGQPVSMQNLREVRALANKYHVPVFFDSARFAENAYFIKIREKGYENASIREIVKEMFSYADGMTMSSKKDGIVNIGGFIGMRDKDLFQQASTFNIMFEGYITYGGMAGRDMNALAQGLREATEEDYLEYRIGQIAYLGNKIKEYGIPVQEPFGGHAVFVDALRFYPHIPQTEYIAQLLGIELYIEGGVRGVEIGTLLADRDPDTRMDRLPKLELLRLAIPRRVYTNNHMDYIAAALKNVFDRRNELQHGFRITWEAPIMRHFTVDLERIPTTNQ